MKGPNVVVMSSAGKPIFARYGNEEHLTQICALAQTLRATSSGLKSNHQCNKDGNPIRQDIRCIDASGLKVAFLSIGHVTLMAVSNESSSSRQETYLFLHLLLEYTYSQIIFILTDQVHNIFTRQANFDMRNLLGGTEHVLQGILDQNQGCLMTCGVQVLCPLDSSVRQYASQVILNCTKDVPNTLYAILLCGSGTVDIAQDGKSNRKRKRRQQLITLVQTPVVAHQLHTTDLMLIMNFVQHQPGLTASGETWVPICFPRLDPSGFVYAYVHHLDPTPSTDTTLLLFSPQSSHEQFEMFRRASQQIQMFLGEKEKSTGDPMTPTRSSTSRLLFSPSKQNFPQITTRLSEEIAKINHDHVQQALMEEYYEIPGAWHFCFRYNVPTFISNGGVTDDKDPNATTYYGRTITQTFVPNKFKLPLGLNPSAQQEMWVTYQKLALRLRYGSSTDEESLSQMDQFTQAEIAKASVPGTFADEQRRRQFSSKCAVAQSLLSTLPEAHNVAYVLDQSKGFMYVGINAKDLELFVTLPSTLPPSRATALCAKLVGKFMNDKEKLFLNTISTYPINEPVRPSKMR